MIGNNYIKDKAFFTHYESREMIKLSDNMPDIGKISSIITDPEISSLRVINTVQGKNSEGEKMTGKMIAVEIRIKQKILYIADVQKETMHMIENESYEIVYVVVPSLILGTELEALVESKYLKTNIRIEEVITKEIDKRTIFRQIDYFVEIYLSSTYQLCYSFEIEDLNSDIYISYEDGTNKRKLTNEEGSLNIKPLWSPDGDKIAFLSDSEGKYMLYIVTVKDLISERITDPITFSSISSYDWAKDGKSIVFAASKGYDKELYIVDVKSRKYMQLTNGKDISKSYKPKYSHDGSKVAFFKSITGITGLYVMDSNGLNCFKVPLECHVKDFDWSPHGEHIVCILRDSDYDKICLVDLKNKKRKVLNTSSSIIKIRTVRFSSDGSLLAFIGVGLDTENIYIYNIKTAVTQNVTRNYNNVQIGDLTWKTNSHVLYYTANDLYYYNIYYIEIESLNKYQLTNTNASYINLNYRPKLK